MTSLGDRLGSGSKLGPGLVLVLATALVSGVSTFVNGYAVSSFVSSDVFVTVRNASVALLLVPLVVLASRYRPKAASLSRADWVRLGTIGLLGGAIPFLLFFHGIELATRSGGVTTASFLYRTLFLFATVLAWFFLRERVSRGVLVGAALLLAGSYALLSLTAPVLTDGTLYVVAATVLWAGEYTLSKRTLATLPSSTVAFARMGFGSAFLAAYLALTAQWGAVAGFSATDWGWVGVSAVLLALFVGTWYAGLARLGLGTASAVLVLGYPVTWLLSVAVQGRSFTLEEALGTLGIVAGVLAIVGVARFRASWDWLRSTFTSRPRADG